MAINGKGEEVGYAVNAGRENHEALNSFRERGLWSGGSGV